jgi:hypothetical protein
VGEPEGVQVRPADGGGADGVRTRDLLDAIEARSQLRYGPTSLLGVSNFIASRFRKHETIALLASLVPGVAHGEED